MELLLKHFFTILDTADLFTYICSIDSMIVHFMFVIKSQYMFKCIHKGNLSLIRHD